MRVARMRAKVGEGSGRCILVRGTIGASLCLGPLLFCENRLMGVKERMYKEIQGLAEDGEAGKIIAVRPNASST